MYEIQSTLDQNRHIRLLGRRIRNRKIPQALLFLGVSGIGRRLLATRFAMTVNCLASPITTTQNPDDAGINDTDRTDLPACGSCPSCKKIQTGQHPDIIFVEPAGRAIKIEQIRSLRQILSLKPYEAAQRVAIVDQAALMTLPAANALLKILEEPPDRTTLILIANNPSDLIATIVSRCQPVRLGPVDNDMVANELINAQNADPAEAKIAAYLAQGSMNSAEAMASTKWRKQKEWILNELIVQTQPVSADTTSPRRAMALAALLASDPTLMKQMVNVMKSWFRDLAIWPFLPEKILHQNEIEPIGKLASEGDPERFYSRFLDLEKLEKAIESNVNLRLALETYFTARADGRPFEYRSG